MTALASQQAGRSGLDFPAILKEAGLTALVALALTFPLVGLRTVDVGSRLTVSPRFTEVAIAVALVFIGPGENAPMTVAIKNNLLSQQGAGWNLVTAGGFLSMIVPLLVFLSLQRFFVRGLTAGAVKG